MKNLDDGEVDFDMTTGRKDRTGSCGVHDVLVWCKKGGLL